MTLRTNDGQLKYFLSMAVDGVVTIAESMHESFLRTSLLRESFFNIYLPLIKYASSVTFKIFWTTELFGFSFKMRVALNPIWISSLRLRFSSLKFNCSRSVLLFTANRTSDLIKNEKKKFHKLVLLCIYFMNKEFLTLKKHCVCNS